MNPTSVQNSRQQLDHNNRQQLDHNNRQQLDHNNRQQLVGFHGKIATNGLSPIVANRWEAVFRGIRNSGIAV